METKEVKQDISQEAKKIGIFHTIQMILLMLTAFLALFIPIVRLPMEFSLVEGGSLSVLNFVLNQEGSMKMVGYYWIILLALSLVLSINPMTGAISLCKPNVDFRKFYAYKKVQAVSGLLLLVFFLSIYFFAECTTYALSGGFWVLVVLLGVILIFSYFTIGEETKIEKKVFGELPKK